MGLTPTSTTPQDKLFRRHKNGDARALSELLMAEQEALYDYALRMTGQVSRSLDSIEDAFQSLNEEALREVRSYTELRVSLYTMVRKFNADIWHADTTKLMNAALEGNGGGVEQEQVLRQMRELLSFQALDKSLRFLPAAEREAVLLRTRARLEIPDIAAVMGVHETEADVLFLSGMTKIDAECSGVVVGPELALLRMPGHPLPERSSQATINLSEVMQGIKTRPVGLSSPLRVVFFVLVGLLACSWWFAPESWRSVMSWFKAWLGISG